MGAAMAEPATVSLREDSRNPGHVTVSVFVGRTPGARGHSGTLALRTDEWDGLRRSGVGLIAAERQIDVEHFSASHDDRHDDNELRWAAAAYLLEGHYTIDGDPTGARLWPWGESSWKPSDDPIRNLVRAGALIAAEIDRLQRMETS